MAFGIDAIQLSTTDQTVDRRSAPCTPIGARKEGFFRPRATTRNARSAVIIDFDPTVITEAEQGHRPNAQRTASAVSDLPRDQATGNNLEHRGGAKRRASHTSAHEF